MTTRRLVEQAFIPGAGLGTRLRPLTERLPKPLVPLRHRPLAAWVMDACARAGIRRFAINTHHLPDAWQDFATRNRDQGADLSLFHEPVLLDTGGGLKNIVPWINDRPLLIHNGDIITTLPLDKLIAAHMGGDFPATLALRSDGVERQVGVDAAGTRVTDLRHILGIAPGTHVFSGVYCIDPEFLRLLPAGELFSVIPVFLELARQGRLGAVIIDEGVWQDLGDRNSYLTANLRLDLAPAVHASARIDRRAVVERSVIGPGCVVGSGALVRESVLWPGSQVEPDARLERCIVFSGQPISGRHLDADL